MAFCFATSNTIPWASQAEAKEYLCKDVGKDWVWFSDHAALSVKYVSVGKPGCKYKVGTGMSVFGRPRGKNFEVVGTKEFTVFGLGAVHIKQADGGKAFKVCVAGKGVKAARVLKIDFP